MEKILTPAAKAAAEFDKRICDSFARLIESGCTKMTAYNKIAIDEGCGWARVYNHLKSLGKV